MLTALLGFLPTLVSGVKEYVGKKQDLQKLERVASLDLRKAQVEAQIERVKSNDNADMVLDKTSLEQTGWKDEYLLILTTLPFIITMVSPFVDLGVLMWTSGEEFEYERGMLAHSVYDGFLAMGKAPEWYWYMLAAVYIHSLGMRRMVRLAIEKFSDKLAIFKK